MAAGELLFLLGVVAQIAIRWPYRASATRGNKDRQERVLLGVLALGTFLLPLVFIFTAWLSFADYPQPAWLVVAGALVLVAALVLFWRSHADLGKNWSQTLDIHEGHRLVTHGVYRRIRHPMYAAGWLLFLAQALLLANWIAGPGGLVAFGLMYFLRVPREEAMMLREFGEDYRAYMARTGRILPRLGRAAQ